MGMTKRGDFLLVESSDRQLLDSMYQTMTVTGCTLDKNDLLKMATGIMGNRSKPFVSAKEVATVGEAISIIENCGWVVLEFLN